MQVVDIQQQLEKLWTDEIPDHMDPDLKKYWMWSNLLGWIIIGLFFLAFIPLFLIGGPAPPEVLCFGCVGISLAMLVIYLAVYIGWYINALYNSYTFLLTQKEIIISRGVFFKQRSVIPYNRVQNINVTSGPLMRVWDLHTVHIHTAGVGMGIAEGIIQGIPFPDELSAIIMKRVRSSKYGGMASQDEMGKDIELFLRKFREHMQGK